MLKRRDIKQIFSLAHTPQSNGGIERFNQTLKRLLKMSMKVNDSRDFVSILEQIVSNYNSTIHSTTGHIPNQVSDKDNEEIHDTIKKKVGFKNDNNEPLLSPILTKVRIKEPDENTGTKWSKEIYTIEKVYKSRGNVSSTSYRLKGKKGRFYLNDLQVINKVENQIQNEEVFTISKILEPMVLNKIPGFIVKWKGYRKASDDTFESRKKLFEDVPKLVERYETEHNLVWVKDKKQGFRFRFKEPKK